MIQTRSRMVQKGWVCNHRVWDERDPNMYSYVESLMDDEAAWNLAMKKVEHRFGYIL